LTNGCAGNRHGHDSPSVITVLSHATFPIGLFTSPIRRILGPATGVGTPTAGRIAVAEDPRRIQIALKYLF
jgi:hypothetical protein